MSKNDTEQSTFMSAEKFGIYAMVTFRMSENAGSLSDRVFSAKHSAS